jgi:hypothetical protein
VKNHSSRWGLFAVVLSLLSTNISRVSAQIQNQWQPDQRVPGYLDNTFTPYMVADQNQTVHVFVSQIISEETFQKGIVYRQWSLSGGWTKTTDILLSPSGDAVIQGAFLDKRGFIHVVFWGGTAESAHIYYSKSPVQNAGSGFSWTRPIIIGNRSVETTSAAITGDGEGNLVVIYNGESLGIGVYEIHSTDFGETWSKSAPIYLTYDSTLLPFSLRLAMGREGRVHAAWNVVTILGEDQSLHYANFDIAGQAWSVPLTLLEKPDERGFFGPSYPSMVDTGKEVIIMYNGGNPFDGLPVPAGRPVQMVSVSKDNGDTWEVPIVPFYRHNGRSGEHMIVMDSNDVVHAIFIQRIEYVEDNKNVVVGGIWHSSYKDGVWSNPERYIPSVQSSNLRAVVSQGNVLLATWIEDQGVGQSGVWYNYMVLDAPELTANPYPTLPVPENLAVPTSSDSLLIPSPISTSVPSLIGSDDSSNPALPLVLGLLPVLVLIGIMLFIYRQRVSE